MYPEITFHKDMKEFNINTSRLVGPHPSCFISLEFPVLKNKLTCLIITKPGDTNGLVRLKKASEDQPGGLAMARLPSSHDKILWVRE